MAFDLLSAMSGIEYPEKTVTVYTNFVALEQLQELEEQAASLGADDTELNDSILAEQRALMEKIHESAIHINLRGLPRSVVQAITKHIEATIKDPAERQSVTNTTLMIRSTVSVTNSAGESADISDEEKLGEFFNSLPSNVWVSLVKAVGEVSFEARTYEAEKTDPNFS